MSSIIKRFVAYSVIIGLAIAIFFIERAPIVQYTGNVLDFVKQYSDARDDILQELRQEIFAPPLKTSVSKDAAVLFPKQIISFTNNERIKNGLPPLAENDLLNLAAMRKIQDMFDRQYFEHVAPDGNGPGYLAEKAGYIYVVVGENLALGSFSDSADLVKAWMDSLGHRENILNTSYLEIGVAVGHGMFGNERVWLAVQEFGKPASSCPVIDPDLKSSIEDQKDLVAEKNTKLTELKKELGQMIRGTQDEYDLYNEKITEYNGVVTSYNSALEKLRKDIDKYNQQVRDFNACAQD